MEEFFRALGGQFAEQRQHQGRAALLFASGCALLAIVWFAFWMRRVLAARRALRAFSVQHAISPPSFELAMQLARRNKLAPLSLLKQIDVFELVTAQSLAAPGGELHANALGSLRRALGYDRLSADEPLHTSRELAAGTRLLVGAAPARVISSTELVLVVQLQGANPAQPGETITFEAPHARQAPYRLHCRLISIRENPEGEELTLAHDESPARLRARDSRHAVHVPIVLRPALVAEGDAAAQTGELLEASAHELIVAMPLRLPPGKLFECAFTLAGQRFRLRAIVADEPSPVSEGRGARLEVRGVSEREEARLRTALGEPPRV